MRARLKARMSEVKDTGIIPEPMFAALCPDRPVADFARSGDFDHAGVLELAFAASSGDPAELETHASSHEIRRPGEALLGAARDAGARQRGGGCRTVRDPHPANRIMAAEALHAAGQSEVAAKALLAELEKDLGEYPTILLLNAVTRLGISDQVPDEWVSKALGKGNANEYVRRFAQEISKKTP